MMQIKIATKCKVCGGTTLKQENSEVMYADYKDKRKDSTPVVLHCSRCNNLMVYHVNIELVDDLTPLAPEDIEAEEEYKRRVEALEASRREVSTLTDEELKRKLWESCVGATCGCTTDDEGKLPCERMDWSCLVYGERPCFGDYIQDMYQEMLDHRND